MEDTSCHSLVQLALRSWWVSVFRFSTRPPGAETCERFMRRQARKVQVFTGVQGKASDFRPAGSMAVWMPRPRQQRSPSARLELQQVARSMASNKRPGQALVDHELEARARMWMQCPICSNELETDVLHRMPTAKPNS